MNKKILVFVIGMTPAIITETIYALAIQNAKWIPDEVLVFTTGYGLAQIKCRLLDSGVFSQLCQDLAVDIDFKISDVRVVEVNNHKLDDIRSVEDNTLFADFITFELYQLCKNNNTQIYVSLAGGRKTMGYYIGYALSLFGRQQDKLMHILVNEPFDKVYDFYYPTKKEQYYQIGSNHICSSQAKIELADIPFVRMRYSLPKELLQGKISFSQAVVTLQTAMSSNINRLVVDCVNKTIICNNKHIKLSAFHLAIYCYFARLQYLGNGYCALKRIDIVLLLELFASCLKNGKNNARFAQISATLNGLDFESTIRSAISKVNSKLRQELRHEAVSFQIEAVKKTDTKIKQYGIKINPEHIIILMMEKLC